MQTATLAPTQATRSARRAGAIQTTALAILDNAPAIRRPLVYALVHRLAQIRRDLDRAKTRRYQASWTREMEETISDMEQEAQELAHTLRPGFDIRFDDRNDQPSIALALPDGREITIPR